MIDTSLPPGKEIGVRLSIDRSLKIESSDAIFVILGVVIYETTVLYARFCSLYDFKCVRDIRSVLLYFGGYFFLYQKVWVQTDLLP